MARTLTINHPNPFREAWVPLLRVCAAVLEAPRPGDSNWFALALARKAARSMYAVASLTSLELWGDALVAGRTLFESEVRLRSLLEGDYEANVRDYLDALREEQARLERKAHSGLAAVL